MGRSSNWLLQVLGHEILPCWKGIFVVAIMGYGRGHLQPCYSHLDPWEKMGWNPTTGPVFQMGWPYFAISSCFNLWFFFVNFNPFTQSFHSSILLPCVFFQLDACRFHLNSQLPPLESMEHSVRVLPHDLLTLEFNRSGKKSGTN